MEKEDKRSLLLNDEKNKVDQSLKFSRDLKSKETWR